MKENILHMHNVRLFLVHLHVLCKAIRQWFNRSPLHRPLEETIAEDRSTDRLVVQVKYTILDPYLVGCRVHQRNRINRKLTKSKSRKKNTQVDLTHFAAPAAAKSLQSCPTLCDPIDGSPPGSPVPGILQARTLERVAISFSNAWKWKVKVKSLSCVRLFTTPWTVAYQAPPNAGKDWG